MAEFKMRIAGAVSGGLTNRRKTSKLPTSFVAKGLWKSTMLPPLQKVDPFFVERERVNIF
jgi:hypothetical protein